MNHSAIASAYNQIADRWLDERFDQSNGIRLHEHALGFLQSETEGWALNVGCRCNTRFNALMRDHGLRIEGVDISGGLDSEDAHVDSTMGPEVYHSTLGIPGLLDVIKDAGCVCRHLEFDQHPGKHLCVIAQRIA